MKKIECARLVVQVVFPSNVEEKIPCRSQPDGHSLFIRFKVLLQPLHLLLLAVDLFIFFCSLRWVLVVNVLEVRV